MSSQETKIELVTEAIETLALAIVAAQGSGDRAAHHQNVLDAREVLKGSLREFLAPSLRIIERIDRVGEASTTLRKTEVVPYGGKGIDGMNLA